MRTLRKTLAQLAAEAQLDAGTGRLTVDSRPVALVYFRAGYTPTDYPSDAEWEARVLVERCDAYKCPSVAYQLAGAKKIQQVRGWQFGGGVGGEGWDEGREGVGDRRAAGRGALDCACRGMLLRSLMLLTAPPSMLRNAPEVVQAGPAPSGQLETLAALA